MTDADAAAPKRRLFGLRVSAAPGGPPEVRRVAIRTVLWWFLLNGGALVATVLAAIYFPGSALPAAVADAPLLYGFVTTLPLLGWLVGMVTFMISFFVLRVYADIILNM